MLENVFSKDNNYTAEESEMVEESEVATPSPEENITDDSGSSYPSFGNPDLFLLLNEYCDGKTLTQTSAMQIDNIGCVLKTYTHLDTATGTNTTESLVFVPGVRVKEIGRAGSVGRILVAI